MQWAPFFRYSEAVLKREVILYQNPGAVFKGQLSWELLLLTEGYRKQMAVSITLRGTSLWTISEKAKLL